MTRKSWKAPVAGLRRGHDAWELQRGHDSEVMEGASCSWSTEQQPATLQRGHDSEVMEGRRGEGLVERKRWGGFNGAMTRKSWKVDDATRSGKRKGAVLQRGHDSEVMEGRRGVGEVHRGLAASTGP